MKKLLFALAALPFCLFSQNEKGANPLVNPKSAIVNPQSTRAVVIGISDYQDEKIPDLRFADRDAQAFANFLRSPAGGSLDADHLKLLTNAGATTAQFDAALGWLIDETKPGDVAVIYFSGHGDVETKTRSQQGFLLCWDSPAHSYVSGAYPVFFLKEVVSTLSTQNGGRVVLVTDACRAGKLAGNTIGGAQLTSQGLAQQFANEVKILSCQPDEFSMEGEQWGGGRGAFSFHLVEGLYGLADGNADQSVSLFEIGRYLEDWVAAEVAPQRQLPMTVGNRAEKLAAVFPELLAQVKKARSGQPVQFGATDNRGIEEEVLASADSTVRRLYLLFKKALREKAFLEPEGACADAYFARLTAEPKLARLHNSMRRNYAAALQDDAQQWLNSFLKDPRFKGRKNLELVRPYPKMLARAAELLGEGHYMYPVLRARQHFFQAKLAAPLSLGPNRELGEKAMAELRESLNWQPDQPHSVMRIGQVFQFMFGQVDSAERYFRKAAELAPSWVLPRTQLALLFYSEKKQFATARAFLDEAEALDSASVDVAYWTANFLLATGDTTGAERQYRKAIRLDPENPTFHQELGAAYLNAGRLREAQAELATTTEMDPGDTLAIYDLARALTGLGRQAEAERQYMRAAPSLPEASYNIACLKSLNGDPAGAFDHLERAILAGFTDLDWMQSDPDLAPLRALPEWPVLMKKHFPDKVKD